MVFLGLLGLALIVFAFWLGFGEIGYAVDGVQAIGSVTDMTLEPPPSGAKGATTHYTVEYNFSPANSDQRISGDGDIEEADWDALTIGGPIRIEYRRSDPAGANRPYGTTDLVVIPMIATFGALFELVYIRAIWLDHRRPLRPEAG